MRLGLFEKKLATKQSKTSIQFETSLVFFSTKNISRDNFFTPKRCITLEVLYHRESLTQKFN